MTLAPLGFSVTCLCLECYRCQGGLQHSVLQLHLASLRHYTLPLPPLAFAAMAKHHSACPLPHVCTLKVDAVRKAAAVALAQVMDLVVHRCTLPAAAVAGLCGDEDLVSGVAACLADRLSEVRPPLHAHP